MINNPFCDRMRERFDDFHDGLISSYFHRVIKKHMTSCSSCREEYAFRIEAIESMQSLPIPDVPAQTVMRVIRNLTDSGGGDPAAQTSSDSALEDGLQHG